ncbi:MAG: phosphatidate cytidylyltransferase [Dehalococcoidales bacterium]|nr:phosphatidate cytidylyltransferase [Dehalococcoidales bacterium]
MRMLKKRIFTTLWSLPLLTTIIWFGEPWLFTTFVAIVGLLAILEFYRLVSRLKVSPIYIFGILWTLFFIVIRNPLLPDLIEPYFDFNLVVPILFSAGIIISLTALLTRKEKFNAFPAWAWTFAGILYVGWLLGYIVALRGIEDGRNWVFYALFCTFGSDTAAFFIGRAIGKHKLAPSISPSKTWEGAIGGLLGAVGVSFLFLLPTPITLTSQLNWWQAVVLGLLVSVFGQVGDLVESLFKRNVGAKDSGTLFPGHGGILDRMDSIVFAVVVVYYWVVCTLQ